MSRELHLEVLVPAPPQQVYDAWTTEAISVRFFAPACRLEPTVGGAFEHYFMLDQPPGGRGSEGCVYTHLAPPSALGFTWNFPPSLPTIRNECTQVMLRFVPEGEGTRVVFSQTGWQTGGEWEAGYDYFARAWRTVLDNLAKLFA